MFLFGENSVERHLQTKCVIFVYLLVNVTKIQKQDLVILLRKHDRDYNINYSISNLLYVLKKIEYAGSKYCIENAINNPLIKHETMIINYRKKCVFGCGFFFFATVAKLFIRKPLFANYN